MATTDTTPIEQPNPATKSNKFRNIFIFIVIAAVLGTAGYFYTRHQKLYPSTDDAYIHANILYVAPQISGKVLSVNVENYQHVAEGDLLVKIDPAPYEIQLEQAKAAYEVATQQNKATDDAILAASANVRAADANLVDVQKTYHRVMDLVNRKLLPLQQGDDVKAKLASAQTNLEAARAKMSQLINQQGAKGDEAPQVKQAAAALSQATLNLSYTNIYAPYDGKLGKVSVRPGSVVSPGLAMMPLIEDNTAWLQANYKEKDIGLLKVGMTATVVLDMYPDVTYQGQVEALSPASGSSFSLLPPENATGNWVKVPQRFPVRVKFTDLKNKPLLRVGASADVTIDTQSETN
ncbi:HlyD family secretion protein [Photobacterium aquimaris]|uniref:HlyD family secretion protein n=1 Tax=Photobacterium aquimaris TaxID=512643 RepID=A0A1B8HUZ9_9GAMM|nr:HlyD family secretion protein [Photobacterium aquimaris]MCP4957147.1 HlyD family secretion protein [Photobacterium aquimaris]OBU14151.1 secretion protein [Photobacterium aquimaris]PQJ38088.1 secretion protein [Photobacterium aquimaris]PSU01555.1 HlyD family secretion protein [Photobacterium aquimaris]SMY16503.1 Multidrug export protein EmrA [Photobacterium aquimaris]